MEGGGGWSQLRGLPSGHEAVLDGVEERVVVVLAGVDDGGHGQVGLEAAVQVQGAVPEGKEGVRGTTTQRNTRNASNEEI